MKLMLVRGRKGRRSLTVQLAVADRDIAQGTDVLRPGRYLFRGAWYGQNLADLATYGKIEGQHGMPIGKLAGRPTPYLLRRLSGSGRIDLRRSRPDSLPPRRSSSYNRDDEGRTGE